VLYVSHGSYLLVSAAQLDEIAAGLAESKARLLWPTCMRRSAELLRDRGIPSFVNFISQ
jgi:hypothetical protein